MKQPEIEPDSLPKQVYVDLAQITDKALPGTSLQHCQTAHNGKARLLCYAPGLPFIQENEVGFEGLCQKDRAALPGAEAFACLVQRWLCMPPRCGHLNPTRFAHFLSSRKTPAGYRHYVMDFGGYENPFVE